MTYSDKNPDPGLG